MIKLLPAFVFLFFLTPMAGQVQLTTDYFPKAGDTLKTILADSAYAASLDQLSPGTDREWNFGTPVAASSRFEPVESAEGDPLFPGAAIKILTNFSTLSYYQVTETEFNLIGLQTGIDELPDFDIITPVIPVRPTRRAPLAYLDQYSTVTSNRATLSPDSIPPAALAIIGSFLEGVDSLRITFTSTRNDLVDAYGTVLLDSKSYEVLRETRNESIFVKLEVKSVITAWTDVTALAIQTSPQAGNFLGQQPRTVTQLYWSPGSIEPVAEFVSDAGTGALQSLVYKQRIIPTSTDGPQLAQATINVYPNPATETAIFEVNGLGRGEYTLSLFNVVGSKLAVKKFTAVSSQERLALNVSDLPQGMYLYNLRNAQGRTIATKRLLVR